jgi:hypothetical protein
MTKRRTRTAITFVVAGLLVAATSIAVALTVTPAQQVSVLGEQIGVAAASPSLSLSGPGVVELFGQRLPTVIRFAGPVRPRLTLAHITLSRQLAATFSAQSGKTSGTRQIGDALASGWTRYFLWEVAIAGGCALGLAGAIAGWARWPARRTVALLVVCVAMAEVANLGGVMVTAYTAPARLRGISSLTALVGQSQLPPIRQVAGAAQADVQVVVIGDSTAAGLGLPGLAHPGKLDRACHRSKDAYSADLAAVNHWHVLNLACSGATIPAGLLGTQKLSKVTAPAQLSEAMKATHASVVIVSVGANDVGWSGLLRLCAAARPEQGPGPGSADRSADLGPAGLHRSRTVRPPVLRPRRQRPGAPPPHGRRPARHRSRRRAGAPAGRPARQRLVACFWCLAVYFGGVGGLSPVGPGSADAGASRWGATLRP